MAHYSKPKRIFEQYDETSSENRWRCTFHGPKPYSCDDFWCTHPTADLISLLLSTLRHHSYGKTGECVYVDSTSLWDRGSTVVKVLCYRSEGRSIPYGATGIFQWHNPSDCIMALGSTQPLTEMSNRQWRTEGWGGWCSTPPPLKFRRPSKIFPNSTRLWKLLKIAEFGTPTPQDVRKKRQ